MMLVTTGLNFQGHSVAAVENELPAFGSASRCLRSAKSTALRLSGVPVASFLGRKRMLEVLAEAQDRSGLPCDTDLEAHIAALKHLGASRIALATRWPDDDDRSAHALSRRSRHRSHRQLLARAARWSSTRWPIPQPITCSRWSSARQAMRAAPNAQAVLMPGGLWHAIHAVPLLEAEFGRPVLLNILSTTWAALHAAGNRMQQRPEPRWSKLLASL